jgi:leader peptidase (prepilin peptidase)/N-methyltransferase
MDWFVGVVCAVFGLAFGSFANVVIHRVPAKRSIVSPPSACPACDSPIAARDNIPVVSWLLLRGRCRACRHPIAARYLMVELGVAVLFALVGWRVGATWALPGYLVFAWTLVVVAVIDGETRKIPNRLIYPLTPALLGLLVAAGLLTGEPGWALRALLGGIAAFAVLLGIALISPRGMGMGDVKLAAFIGIGLGYLSWGHVLLGIFGGFLVGGVVAILLLGSGRRGRKDMLPFGPYLAISALLSLLVGETLIAGYQRLVGLG